MNYRSIQDLSQTIKRNVHQLPDDIDLVVGVPRSGLLAANIVALQLNLKVCSLESFFSGAEIISGSTRSVRHEHVDQVSKATHVLVIDDSVLTGDSLKQVKSKVQSMENVDARISYCSIYVTEESKRLVEYAFEIVESPRFFEWNILHRPFLTSCCVDMDGVLCLDPEESENDDGEKYLAFLKNAKVLCSPTYPIGHIVTSRLEKYRPQTVEWLASQNIQYDHLHMLDLPSAAERRRLGIHAQFKADVYKQCANSYLFIESEHRQAVDIANMSGKNVLSFTAQKFIEPDLGLTLLKNSPVKFSKKLVKKSLKRLLPAITIVPGWVNDFCMSMI